VHGVGDERKRTGVPAAEEFGEENDRGEEQDAEQGLQGGGHVTVIMVMPMMVMIVVVVTVIVIVLVVIVGIVGVLVFLVMSLMIVMVVMVAVGNNSCPHIGGVSLVFSVRLGHESHLTRCFHLAPVIENKH